MLPRFKGPTCFYRGYERKYSATFNFNEVNIWHKIFGLMYKMYFCTLPKGLNNKENYDIRKYLYHKNIFIIKNISQRTYHKEHIIKNIS